MPVTAQDIQSTLLQLFRAHGVEASLDGEWIGLPRPYTRIQAAVVGETPHPNAVVVQLDVRCFVGFGRLLIESFGGVGCTRTEAVRNALEGFTTGSLHVLLAAVLGREQPGQVETEAWVIGGTSRRVSIGPAVLKGSGPQPAVFDTDWWTAFRHTLTSTALAEGTHWVRLYYSRKGSDSPIVEVLLDNEPSPTVQSAVAAYAWPSHEGFFSARLFLVIQGGVDACDLAAILWEHRERPDQPDEIDALARTGLSLARAELATCLIPLAFGRALLASLPIRFGDEALIIAAGKPDRDRLRLSADPLFCQATSFAQHVMTCGTLTRDQIFALAFRSPETRAVNEALQAGSKPEDLVAGPPTLIVSSSPDGDEDVPAPPPTTETAAKPTGATPWWRRWLGR